MNRYYNISSLGESSEGDFTIQPAAAPDAPEHRPSASQEDSNTLHDHNLSSLLRMHVLAPGRRRLPAVATSTPIRHVENDQVDLMISPISSITSDLTESPPSASLDYNSTGQSPPEMPALHAPPAPPVLPEMPAPHAPPAPPVLPEMPALHAPPAPPVLPEMPAPHAPHAPPGPSAPPALPAPHEIPLPPSP